MPIIETRGALSSRGYGQFAQGAAAPTAGAFIEDVFSTTLYTGTGAAQSIPNGIKLANGATSAGWFSLLSASPATISLSANAIAVSASNEVYACGSLQTTPNASFLAKYTPSGSVTWQQIATGAALNTATAVAVHSSGNVYVAGRGTVGTNGDFLLSKYTSAGASVWHVRLGGAALEFATGVATDAAENIYVCGRGNVGTNAFLVAKFDSSGSLLWQRTLNGANSDEATGIAVDSSGDCYISGISDSPGFNTAFLVKYNTSGVLQWQTLLSGFSNISAQATAVDPSGFVYIAGLTQEGTPSQQGFLLAKYNASGVLIWQKRLSSATTVFIRANSVSLDTDGNVYVGGRDSTGSPEFGILAKYNSSGTLQWQRKLICSENSNTTTSINSIFAVGNESIYFGGTFAANVNTNQLSFFVGRVPTDGSGTGVYTLNGLNLEYSATSYTDSVSTATSSAGSLTDAAGTSTVSTPTLTMSTGALASSLSTMPTGAGLGGLVWIKGRSGATDHALYDTARGATFDLASNLTTGQTTQAQGVTAFLGSGFSIGTLAKLNTSSAIYTAWTFAEQPKFFDVVTYTGNGVAGRTVAHNLGSVPGCIIVKRTDATGGDWQVYHVSRGANQYLVLNSSAASATAVDRWNSTAPTASVFSLGTSANVNANGGTYVAYLFANNAGGFGVSGTDSAIACGNYNGNGSATGPVISLGWEPQLVIIKNGEGTSNWFLADNVRGATTGNDAFLYPNLTTNEEVYDALSFLATGFQLTSASTFNTSANSYIYIAIRRGPMRTPTSGSSVFTPTVYTGTNVNNRLVNTSIAPDMVWMRQRNDTVLAGMVVGDRLRGQPYLLTGSTAAEVTSATAFDQQLVSATEYGNAFSAMNGVYVGTDATAKLNVNTTANNHIAEAFRRAPGFFDVVCYTGTGSAQSISHNLGVVPEFIITAARSSGGGSYAYVSSFGRNNFLYLYAVSALDSSANFWGSSGPTSSSFGVGGSSLNNGSGDTYVAYLFASAPGVSKIGTYTGTGSTVQVNCGFTAGARFVLIKRTDATGSWYVWDSARGIIAGNDPYLVLNSTAAEVTSTDWVDTLATGFEVSNAGSNLVNVNGGNYIFLAIA